MGKNKTPRAGRRKRTLTRPQLSILRNLVSDVNERKVILEMVEDGELDLPERELDLRTDRRFKPVHIPGKPVSQTIIEERR
jgi:hypothetical protein